MGEVRKTGEMHCSPNGNEVGSRKDPANRPGRFYSRFSFSVSSATSSGRSDGCEGEGKACKADDLAAGGAVSSDSDAPPVPEAAQTALDEIAALVGALPGHTSITTQLQRVDEATASHL